MSMFKYEDISVPFDVLGRAYHTVQSEKKGRNPEYWDTGESRRFRELLALPITYDEDKLRRLAVSFRKKPEGGGGWFDYKKNNGIAGKKGGNGVYKDKKHRVLSECEKRILESDWPALRADCLKRDKGVCRCCGRPAVQAHHLPQGYDKMRTLEEIDYLTAVCVSCHAMITARMRHPSEMDKFVDKLLGSMTSIMKGKLCQSNSR